MQKTPLKGLARLRAAFVNSMTGLRDVWRNEEAFRLEAAALMLAVPAAVWLADSVFQGAILVASVLLVMIVEVLNTAVEAVVDRIGPERHELSRIAKDLGSLAVLLASVLAAMVWLAALVDGLLA
ncbi:diacylglycerol kinase [Rhodovulum marinum]|uniref:Diacylglycerol kinase n=1 Tax=Rhodovulum marinum TaxID=320662 RepID=A0A4R2Q2X1_9RHOB|nr:diacylglycerol kinase [Rhodovulum marinum]TCP42890.1 diacylglycerol kinase [Rhodovulum marinum]